MEPIHPRPASLTECSFLGSVGMVDIFTNGHAFHLHFGYYCTVFAVDTITKRAEPYLTGPATTYRDHPLRADIDAFIQAYKNLLS